MEGKKYVEAAGGGCGWSHVSGGHDDSVRLLLSGPSQFSYASAGRVGVCGSCAHQAMDTNSGFGFLGVVALWGMLLTLWPGESCLLENSIL